MSEGMIGTSGVIESTKQFRSTPSGVHQRWDVEISAAMEARKRWADQAEKAVKQYTDERVDGDGPKSRLNLFAANTNIVLSILYGQMPKVDVSRRFCDADDDEARVSSEIMQRHLNTDIEDGDDFSENVRGALQDWKITGLGVNRVRYECEMETVPGQPAITHPVTGEELAPEVPDHERKVNEHAEIDYIHWRDVLWSPCRRWKDVRWIAFKNELTRDEAVKRFGEEIGRRLPLEERGGKKGDRTTGDELKEAWSRVIVWEIWDKDSKTVYWFCRGYDRILDQKPDPIGLKSFFPCPRPLIANSTTTRLMPKPDFTMDQNLYDEINTITDRLNRLERCAKVAGAYDKGTPDLVRILEETNEGQLIPVEGWAKFSESGGIAGCMQFVPLDPIVNAIQVLSQRRAEKISMLDQRTGLSDIIRGQADQRATATEQRIKAGFASTRLQTEQDEVARFASELQQIKGEMISLLFDPQTILDRSNAIKLEIDPVTKQPNMDLINRAVGLLKSEFWNYRINVKADSIAMRDYASLKQERVETIGALAGLFQQAVPMVQMFPQAAPFILEVGKWLISATKGSQQLEGLFDKFSSQAEQAAMAPKPPPPPDPKMQAEQVKAQAEAGKAQAGIQQTVIDGKVHMVKAGLDMQVAQAQHGMAMQKMAAEHQVQQEKAAAAIIHPLQGV
jgi:hypothetical protein